MIRPPSWLPGAPSRLRLALVAALLLGGAARASADDAGPAIQAIGVENEYADVISQVGGRYVQVSAIETDPNTDPHSFEISPRVARRVATARLIVLNGLGYDGWASRMIAATPRPGRQVVDVQRLLGLPDGTPNPHVWYDPATMPAVAQAVAADLSRMQPAHAAYFRERAAAFDAALKPWTDALAALRKDEPGAPVAVTEPVGDDLLQAAGAHILTPFSLQTAVMNGTDPAPQDVTRENALLAGHQVRVLVYNQQVTDPLTQSFLSLARKHGIPIVGVYETMPTPGYSYQSWMLAETLALRRALVDKRSAESLLHGSN